MKPLFARKIAGGSGKVTRTKTPIQRKRAMSKKTPIVIKLAKIAKEPNEQKRATLCEKPKSAKLTKNIEASNENNTRGT